MFEWRNKFSNKYMIRRMLDFWDVGEPSLQSFGSFIDWMDGWMCFR